MKPPQPCWRSPRSAVAATLLALLAGPAAQARPVMLHARIELNESADGGPMKSDLHASLRLSAPAVQGGTGGPRAGFANADPIKPTTLQGQIRGNGSADVTGASGALREQFSMQSNWPNAVALASPAVVGLLPPRLSDYGEGLDIQIKLNLPMRGTWSLSLNGQAQSDTAGSMAKPTSCRLASSSSAWCQFDLSLSPPPTVIRDPQLRKNADVQQVLAQMQQAAGDPQTRAMLGFAEGTFLNAPTEWLASGHFVTRLVGSYAPGGEGGGASARRVNIVVWSSDPGDDREPQPR